LPRDGARVLASRSTASKVLSPFFWSSQKTCSPSPEGS
jgi:hypothetical protein